MVFTVDIWRIILRFLFRDEETSMRLLWVCQNSRKGALSCVEWWGNMYPLRFKTFTELKKQTIKMADFPYFCLYFTIEARIDEAKQRLSKTTRYLTIVDGKTTKKRQEQEERRERDMRDIVILEQKLSIPNPIVCPIQLNKTVHKKLMMQAKRELKHYGMLRFISYTINMVDDFKVKKPKKEDLE